MDGSGIVLLGRGGDRGTARLHRTNVASIMTLKLVMPEASKFHTRVSWRAAEWGANFYPLMTEITIDIGSLAGKVSSRA